MIIRDNVNCIFYLRLKEVDFRISNKTKPYHLIMQNLLTNQGSFSYAQWQLQKTGICKSAGRSSMVPKSAVSVRVFSVLTGDLLFSHFSDLPRLGLGAGGSGSPVATSSHQVRDLVGYFGMCSSSIIGRTWTFFAGVFFSSLFGAF